MNIEFALETPNFSNSDEQNRWLPIRPYTGIWWADCLWLALAFALHQNILPSILGSYLPIDLLTPWLVIIFVVSPPLHAISFWFIGSMLLETSSLAPKGLYLCSYWIILSVLILARRTLSWKLVIPWLVTFFFAGFWIGNFETLMIFLTQDPKQLDFTYFFSQMIRILLSCLIGMTLAQSWMARFKGERVKSERHQR